MKSVKTSYLTSSSIAPSDAANRNLSRVRVKVERALAGVKRSHLVKEARRNTQDDYSGLVIVVAYGLHNLRVRRRKRRR